MSCTRASQCAGPLIDYFRCPSWFADSHTVVHLNGELGSALAAVRPHDPIWQDSRSKWISTSELQSWVDLLRFERYEQASTETTLAAILAREAYYLVRPLLGVTARRYFQKLALSGWKRRRFPRWPVDQSVDQLHEMFLMAIMERKTVRHVPFIWFWPKGYDSCALVTHDVETKTGLDFCPVLMDIDESHGIRSAFQLIPEHRYVLTSEHLARFHTRGFETNVHDLNHDGHLFRDMKTFRRRVERINEYGRKFGALGFRSGALYRNEDWYDLLEFEYDMSVPNVAHLDPQHGGCCTIFPYFIGNILELPVTAIQDYSLFHVVGTYSTDLWRTQLNYIASHHGLINVIIHPDYVIEERARHAYSELLAFLSGLAHDKSVWLAQPHEVNSWWRKRSRMRLEWDRDHWTILGEGHERATIAYASLGEYGIRYSADPV